MALVEDIVDSKVRSVMPLSPVEAVAKTQARQQIIRYRYVIGIVGKQPARKITFENDSKASQILILQGNITELIRYARLGLAGKIVVVLINKVVKSEI